MWITCTLATLNEDCTAISQVFHSVRSDNLFLTQSETRHDSVSMFTYSAKSWISRRDYIAAFMQISSSLLTRIASDRSKLNWQEIVIAVYNLRSSASVFNVCRESVAHRMWLYYLCMCVAVWCIITSYYWEGQAPWCKKHWGRKRTVYGCI